MQSIGIVFTALAMAFCWVEFINPFKKTKPFNCIKCMTGWISGVGGVFKALLIQDSHGITLYLFCIVFISIGVFVGAMFESIKMRWL